MSIKACAGLYWSLKDIIRWSMYDGLKNRFAPNQETSGA
ncbi:MAG: hypothetical protein QOJ99_1125 [Bryobacterales bacterium]|jgi:hypothetical protein|nr:hypothetical protein [Bryobacterales bacterium]